MAAILLFMAASSRADTRYCAGASGLWHASLHESLNSGGCEEATPLFDDRGISPGDNAVDSVCPFTIVTSSTPVSCNGFSDGVARVDSVIGETGPLQYVWLFNGSTADSLGGLGPGTYTVRVTDVGTGCVHFKSQAVTEPAELVIFATPPPQDATCFGVCDGEGSVTAIDGTPPYNYLWSHGCTESTCTGLCSGAYTIVVTDVNGCQDSISINILEPGLLVANEGSVNVQCTGNCDGSAFVNPTGGTLPYTYLWDTGATTDSLGSLCPGNYNITVTDQQGCQALASFTITEPLSLSSTPNDYNVSCGGLCDGAAAVSVTGGTLPYTFLWSPGGETTDSISGLCFGAYSVTITDANGCTEVENFNITEPVPLISSITDTTHVLCLGGCNGTAIVTPSGGTSPYTYVWNNATTDSTATGLCAGNYSVTITDDNGCTSTSSVTVTEPPLLTQNLSPTNANCFGVCDGSATSNPSGGTPPFSYLWSNGQTTATATGLCAGTFTVTVTDQNGCQVSGSTGIAQPPSFTGGIVNSTNISCGGLCDGSATFSASGGTPGYTYLWSNGATTLTATGLCAGNVSVTATDNNGCTVSDNIVITEPLPLSSSIPSSTNLTCNNVCTGSATVSGSGGTLPYSYLWGDGQTTATATGLCAGNMTVTVTDANGCTSSSNINLTEPPAYTSGMSKTDPACGGACDGTATVTANGGTPGYSYLWSNGCTTMSCAALCSGWYYVTVTDNNSCTLRDSIEVPVTPIPALDSSSVTVSCNGVCDGSGTITATGGTAPYTYLWSSGCTTASCTALCAGSYTITVTDNTGCATTATLTVPGLNVITPNEVINDAQCNAICDGSVTLGPTGGTPPYTYLWSTGCTTNTCGGLCSGNVSITITDQNGCTTTPTLVIGVTNPVVLTTSTIPASCFGQCDGTVTVNPAGGSPPYTYSWSNGCTTISCTGICAGNYNVTVTGSAGCNNTGSVTVTEPPALTSSWPVTTHISCFSLCDGAATVTPAGGTAPYNYLWNSGATANALTGLCAGNYNVTITDANGCQLTDGVILTEPAILVANESGVNSTCGNADGNVSAGPTGGTSPYTYNWDNGCTQSTCTGLSVGVYNLTVTDANGCTDVVSVTINDVGGPTGESFTDIATSCFGVCDGQSTVAPVGGTPAYTYLWADGQTTATATGLCGGNTTVTITDANGCRRIASTVIVEPGAISATFTDTTLISCNGLCNAAVTVTPAGGSSPYTYLWNNATTDSSATGLCAGLYNVTVTDANGCSTSTGIIITEPPLLTTSITDTTHILCNSQCDGMAIVTPAGGIAPYSYSWSDGQTDSVATGLCAGGIGVTVTDVRGCQTTDTVTITEPAALTSAIGNVSHVSCNGACDGSALAQGNGGVAPYNYAWSSGHTTQNASALCGGPVTVTITDANGCTSTSSTAINEPVALTSSITDTIHNSCNGDCNGQAITTPVGGVLPYTFVWSNGQTDSTATGLCAGNHTVTTTDANGCVSLGSVTITEPVLLYVDSGVVSAACGNCNGIGIALPNGGASNYTYAWSNGCTTGTCTGLCVGVYGVTVTDANGCTASNQVVIGNSNGPTSGGEVITNTSCNAVCDGAVTLNPAGGQPPYTYQWNDAASQTTASISGLCAGNYTVSITDNQGCILPVVINVTEPSVLLANMTDSAYIACSGQCSGTATVTPAGGTSPYNYLWSDGQTVAAATGLCAGTATVTITDAQGCTTQAAINILQPSPLAPVIGSSTNLSCFAVCNGTANVTTTGGYTPYTYAWSDGQTDSTATGLCSGQFTVTVTDSLGCTAQSSVTITEPSAVTANPSSVNSNCGVCDGSVAVAPTGGTPAFTYQWSDAGSQTSATATGLCSGLYTVTITDANGCTHVEQVPLNDNGGPASDTATTVDVGCNGNCTGQGTISVTGGTPPYTFQWNDAASHTSATATGLCAGTYFVVVTDNNGCKRIPAVTINESTILTGTFSDTTHAACYGNCDGSATYAVSGGTPPYTYLWDDASSQTTAVVTGLCTGTYVITFTDAQGCTGTDSVLITEPAALTLNVAAIPTVICNGDTAFVNASAGGGSGGYTYLWNDPLASTGSSILVSPADTFLYQVTVTDANGCTITGSDSLAVITPGTPVLGPDTGICRGDTLQLNGMIVNGPGTYLWTTNGSGYFVPDSTSPNAYYVPAVTDSTIEIYLTSVGACNNVTDTMRVTVGVNAMVAVGADQEVSIGTKSIQLTGTVQFASGGRWTTNGKGTFVPSDTALVVTYIPHPSDFDLDSLLFTLTSEGNGCSLAADWLIVEFIEVIIPNVFTPYPESPGFNDVFFIRGLPQGSKLVVFNRWGIKVFQSDYYRNDWDGAGLKGDVYYYVLSWEGRSWKGYVHLLRKENIKP